MFDILVYLYENYGVLEACQDVDALSRSLADAGFEDDEIVDAIGWLQELARLSREGPTARESGGFRVYTGAEAARLGNAAIGFLAFLDGAGQITTAQRELVVERACALAETPVPLPTLKVIVLMVLWSQSAEIDLLLLEELLDDGDRDLPH